ncbi:MAG: hypothetical protein WAP27_05960 [Tepidanaerobacteraceae bacterium]
MEKNKKAGHIKSVKSLFKGAVRNTTILVMSTSLVTYPLDFPCINAFFTDRIVYSNHGSIFGKRSFATMGKAVVELCFDIHTFNNLNVDFNVEFIDDILTACMNLPDDCGFNADDIIIGSLEMSYKNEKIDLIPIDVQTKGKNIELKYDWSKIERFIDAEDNTPSFDISGNGQGLGKSGLGEKFKFKGFGRIADLQQKFYEQMKDTFFVEGPDYITIPLADEGTQVYSYAFYIDGREVPAEEVEWELLSDISGVRLEAGQLIVSSEAEMGNISIIATLKSNRYFKYKLEVELIKPEEEIQEIPEELPQDPAEVPEEGENEGEEFYVVPGIEQGNQEDINLPAEQPDNKLNDDKDEDDDSGQKNDESNNDDKPDANAENDEAGGDDDTNNDKDEDGSDSENEEDTESEEEAEKDEMIDDEDQSGEEGESDDDAQDTADNVDEEEEKGQEGDEDEITDEEEGAGEEDDGTDGTQEIDEDNIDEVEDEEGEEDSTDDVHDTDDDIDEEEDIVEEEGEAEDETKSEGFENGQAEADKDTENDTGKEGNSGHGEEKRQECVNEYKLIENADNETVNIREEANQ